MEELRRFALHTHPHWTFLSTSFVLCVSANQPEYPFIPAALLLTTLLVYAPKVLGSRTHRFWHIFSLWLVLTTAASLPWFAAAWNAFSLKLEAILVPVIFSALKWLIGLAVVLLCTQLRSRAGVDSAFLFPAIWTAVWWAAAHISPTGYLGLGIPNSGITPFRWAIHLFGPHFINWTSASLAVVLSRAVEAWLMGYQSPEETPLLGDSCGSSQSAGKKRSNGGSQRGVMFLFAFLIALVLPSFILDDVPDPALVLGQELTPLGVGCILPSRVRHKHANPTLEDFIKETEKMRPMANVLLWPEGAVTFKDDVEKEDAFRRIRKRVPGPLIGVSYEEWFVDGDKPQKRTVLAVISSASDEPHLVYEKRHLVPLVESYSLTPSSTPPAVYEYPLRHPRDMNKTDWAPPPNYTRPISMSAGICLDIAMPSPFKELEVRPQLILAPARTWDVSIGRAMWRQAQLRAEEIGSIVLWCDGGIGGVSGISSGLGRGDLQRIGEGSWVKKIGIQYPFDQGKTTYATYGSELGMATVWLITFAAMVRKIPFAWNNRMLDMLRNARARLLSWRQREVVQSNPDNNTNLLE